MTLWIWLGLVASASIAVAESPGHYGYGKPASPAEIAGWDIDVRGDDGAGLPPR
ncbi:MAG: S-disulfanyl-L-cysteine oxidoreductase SoxD [Bradyrhizobium sp.]|jgi:cytochrome c|nr:S-disulfanyl-L-cysteine oxidoreductase SoxD [Bradyrhizobium sp.]